jgi:hypothetical protein
VRTGVACEAMKNRRCLELRYDGFTRVVEVHAVGETTAGHLAMSAWQVRGGSSSNEDRGWKTFLLDEISSAVEIDETSEAPRPDYVHGSRQFRRIICQL